MQVIGGGPTIGCELGKPFPAGFTSYDCQVKTPSTKEDFTNACPSSLNPKIRVLLQNQKLLNSQSQMAKVRLQQKTTAVDRNF